MLILFAAGCGGAAPPTGSAPPPGGDASEAPAGEPERLKKKEEPLSPAERERHIDDALREVEAAERALEKELTKRGEAETPGLPGDHPQPPRTDPKGCDTACSTLGSMQRAAAYVCRLAGDGDVRCRAAQDRVRTARTKIQRAACSCAEPVASNESDDEPTNDRVAVLRPLRLYRFVARR